MPPARLEVGRGSARQEDYLKRKAQQLKNYREFRKNVQYDTVQG
jgi:hypothetical protein